jgi:hypothetical protein
MAVYLRQSTAVNVKVGPFLDETDGDTPLTSLTITQPDIQLTKNGGTFAQKSAAQTLTHDIAGWYTVALSTTDTNTLGTLILQITEATALPVWREFNVITANAWDALFAGTGVGIRANVQGWLGTAPTTPGTAGVPNVDTLRVGNTVQTAANIPGLLGALNVAAATGDPGTTITVIAYLKQLINVLIGTAGVTTFPAAAAPGNAVSLAEVLRAVYDDTNEIQVDTNALNDTKIPDTISLANINAEVVDTLNTDTYAEPAQGAPGATISLAQKIGFMYKFMRNRVTSTSSAINVFNDDATTVDHKATFSDDTTTADRTEFISGP